MASNNQSVVVPSSAIVCSGNQCTVTIQVAPIAMTDEQILDIGLLFGLFLTAGVIIFSAKQLLNIFKVNSDD